MFFSGYVFSKYDIAQKMYSSYNIAVPVIEIEGEEIKTIDATNNKGEYSFTVKNYNDDNISDVGLDYYIEIISPINEGINFTLYKESSLLNLEDFKTEKIYMPSKEKTEHKYKLGISYDKTVENSQQDILGNIQIRVYSQQQKN